MHRGREKMAAIFQTTFLEYISLDEGLHGFIQISLKFVLKGPVENARLLVQEMVWHRICASPAMQF